MHLRSTLRLSVGITCVASIATAADLVPSRIQSTLAAPMVEEAPTIDGSLGDTAWEVAQPLRIRAYKNAGVRYPTDAWICRDAFFLYIGARCYEDNLAALVTENEGSMIWKNDCLEVFFVPAGNELYWTKIMLDSTGRFTGSIWAPDEWGEPVAKDAIRVDIKTGREDAAWTVEMAVPIKPFGVELSPETPWAFGINRAKYTSPSEVSSLQGGFNRPAEYPELVCDGRAIVFDGVGLKNLGRAKQEATYTVSVGERRASGNVTLKPGETHAIDWEAAVGGLEENAEFTVSAVSANQPAASETYRLVPAPKKMAKVDPRDLPPPEFRASPFDDPAFFPIAVWLQPAPESVIQSYRDIGVNVYFGGIDSYPNPKDKAWLDAVRNAGMYAIIAYKQKYVDNELYKHPAVIGWHHADEPDLPQSGGSVVPAETLMADFLQMRGLEIQHRVFLNLSQSVANDRYVGHLVPYDQYPVYCRAADVVQYDIYPCNSLGPRGPDRLHVVAKGMDRLSKWTDGRKLLGFAVEVNKFTKSNVKDSRSPTPDEVKTQMWMAIVHGARYLNLFCHSWAAEKMKANGIEPDMMAALKPMLGEIHELAPVINSPTVVDGAAVKTAMDSRVDTLVKRHDGATYVLAVNMYRRAEKPEIVVAGVRNGSAEVLFENRTVPVKNGALVDEFAPYAVHRYRIR